MIVLPRHISLVLLLTLPAAQLLAQDSSRVLKKVTVKGVKRKNPFTTVLPAQSLNQETLQKLNAPTAADAARYFSGVQVKDYGGVGGLKTISVRSLGAAHTTVFYDGLPVADMQAGQIDLGHYSSSFLQSLDLYQANPSTTLLPARAFASASVLSLQTTSYYPAFNNRTTWKAGVRNGSFGYWQGFGGATFQLPRNTQVNVFADAITSKGNYPFTIENGTASEKSKRNNSEVRSLQGELNLTKIFKDSSLLQIKGGSYVSKRGLPGVITFYNSRSVQKLYDQNYYAQARYVNQLTASTSLLVSGKFDHTYTRYVDPDYLSGIDNRYHQQQVYASVAINQSITNKLTAALATDASYATLKANTKDFVYPSRTSSWNNALLAYTDSLWQIQASVLWSYFSDKTKTGTATGDKNKFTPTLAISRKLQAQSPWLFRAFYKHVYRMPTFNDLYYNFIGNNKLQPELAVQYDAGVVFSKRFSNRLSLFSISIDGYFNQVKDKIVATPAQNLFAWTMLNLGKVDIKGADVTLEAGGLIGRHVNWLTRVAYTYQQALNMTDPNDVLYKNRIPYTPDHSGSGLLSFGYKQWNAGYSFIFSGTRYTLGENNPFNQLDGWGTHDVYVSHNILWRQTSFTIKAEVNNVTDQRYDIVRYYPMPGRSYKISLLVNH